MVSCRNGHSSCNRSYCLVAVLESNVLSNYHKQSAHWSSKKDVGDGKMSWDNVDFKQSLTRAHTMSLGPRLSLSQL